MKTIAKVINPFLLSIFCLLSVLISSAPDANAYTVYITDPSWGYSTTASSIWVNWYYIPEAVSFRVDVSSNSDFSNSNSTTYDYNITGVEIINLPQNDDYQYIRITAYDSYGGSASNWIYILSESFTWPPAPTLTSPSNNSYVNGSRADLYYTIPAYSSDMQIVVALDANFTDIYYDSGWTGYNHSHTWMTGLLDDGQPFYWKVRAENWSGISNWSSTYKFTNGNSYPVTPLLIAPCGGNLAGNTVNFSWQSAAHASGYYGLIARDSGFSDLTDFIYYTGDTNESVTDFLNDGRIYYWKVASYNLYGDSAYSNACSFQNGNKTTPVVQASSLPNAYLGMPYTANALQATGGLTPYTWSIWNGDAYWQFRILPPGLSLDPSSGVISGTPTSTGSYDFRVQVLDSQPPQLTGYNTFYIPVYSSVSINTTSLPAGNVNSSYSQSLSASGGSGNYTWSLDSGSLPSGLSLSSSGAISGTISGSSATFTVRVRDAQYPSATTTRPLTITVYPQLQVTTDFLPAAAGSVPYSQALAASGGYGSYSWSIDSGSLPPNFTLSSGGTISGTPISSGNYNFTVRVYDSQSPQKTATKPLTLNIYANLSVTTLSISNGTSGTSYSQQLYASGGNGLYVWSVVSGSLPAGVGLSSNGTLSGIPADVGQFSFTAQVTDTQNSPPASYSYSMTITNGAMQQCADNPVSVSSGATPNVCTLSTTNVISGVVDHDQELFATKGGMLNIAISLFYKSLPAYNGSLGSGWSHSYDISLILNADGSIILKNGNGDKRYYAKSGSTYISPTGDFSTLVKNGNNTYTISYRDGSKYNFDTVGKITSLIDRYQNAITFTYTGSDITTITDSTGRFATIGYDQSTTPHRILTVTDPNYNVYNFSYQGSNLYRVTNPEATYGAGRGYWEYQYNADGLLRSKRDPNGNISQYSYYADKKMQTATDPNGRTRTIVYPTTTDTLRTSTLTEKDGGQWLYTFDSSTGVIKQKTDPNGKITNFYYYANGLVKAKTEPKDGATRLTTFYKHDAFGNIEIETDPVDVSTYNPVIDPDTVTNVADLVSKTPPIKAVQHYIYDTDINNINNPYHYDRLTSVADERGTTTRTTSFAYTTDSYGEVVTATATPGNYFTITKKNANGSVRVSVDANSKTSSFTYYANDSINRADGIAGLLWLAYAPDGTSNSFAGYDNNGNVFRVFSYDNTGASNLSIIFQFDTLNRLIQQLKTPNTLPSSSTHYYYDFVGNTTSVVDAESHETKYEYNYNRQTTKITDAKLNDTIFKYTGSEQNGIDQLIGVYDANVAKNTPLESQPHTAYIYDDLGRLESETDPLGKKIYYTYYDNGLLKEKYDATSATPGTLLVTYTYNNRGQITDKTFTDGTYEHYTYTANGQLLTAANQNISYTYAYYTDGRLQSVTDNSTPTNRKISYDQYDALGQRKQVTILKDAGTDQRIITYDYDSANRPWHITSTAGQFTYGYDTYGRRQTVTYPNPTPYLLTANYVYDDLSRLTSLTHKNGTSAFATFNYTQFDNVGNRKTVTGSKNETYGYDENYRLTSVTATKSEAFTYDAAGNRLTGSGATDTTYQSNAANQMTQGRKLAYGYDSRGNQATKTVPGVTDKTCIRTWDLNNRLTKEEKIKGTEVKTVTYKYDPFGRRIEKKFIQTKGGVTETETTNYVYDSEDIAVEYFTTAGGTEKTFYTHGHGIDEPLALERGGSYYYYHADGLGSITHITNAAKTVVQSYTYDAYGMATPSTDFRNSYQHTSREYDWETGLQYLRERYRDLMDGNFISKDPISFAGGDVNLYRFVQSNPQNYVDPDGLSVLTPDTPSSIPRFPAGGIVSSGSGNLAARSGGSASATATELTAAAKCAANKVGTGRGPVYGTKVHSAFESEVKGLGRNNLTVEQSYLNGEVVSRGTRGSVRADVIEGPLNSPTAIYDLKTGSATLTPARIQQLQQHILGGPSSVPILEIRP